MILIALLKRLKPTLNERIATFLRSANNLTDAMDLLRIIGIRQKINMLHRLQDEGLIRFDFNDDSITVLVRD